MKKFYGPLKDTWEAILQRPTIEKLAIEKLVKEVFEQVQTHGDQALVKYTKKFDGADLSTLKVSEKEIRQATTKVPDDLKAAIQIAKRNIEKFHKAQQSGKIEVETTSGVLCWQEKKPISAVGLYIPGGTAPLFSTILMLAIPASMAGCKQIVLCSPPDANGTIHPAILYTAALCGVSAVYKLGGIQAIAGMTFGTDQIQKVHKIFGPGNQYVTAAKQFATAFHVAIDMPAGPSELLVVADEDANAAFVASDLLSQAEHGTDSQVMLITTSKAFMNKVEGQIENQILNLPRKEIALEALKNSKLIYMEDETVIMDFVNSYAPEHLIINCKNEEFYLKNIENAGSVFLGDYSPEAAGDYASGTNHTLPTNGYAKQYSGVNLDSFMKSITFQRISSEGIKNIGQTIEILATAEGLEGHKNAVTLRLKSLEK